MNKASSNSRSLILRLALCGVPLLSFISVAMADEVAGLAALKRTELERADVTGEPGKMDVVVSILEVAPGDIVPYHVHHGVETSYVLQDCLLQPPGDYAPIPVKAGSTILNLRDAPHGGVRVIGTQSFKALIIHVADRDRPLTDLVSAKATEDYWRDKPWLHGLGSSSKK